MHQVARISAHDVPWDLPLHTRLQALSRGRSRVAYFYEQADDSTFRYRIYNMVQSLDVPGGDVSASYFFLSDLHCLPEIADIADLLVICRTRYDHRVNHLITAFRRLGKRVLFDVDDLVFDTAYAHLIQRTLDQDLSRPEVWDHWFAYSSRLGATLRLCDGGITTNECLAGHVSEFADVPVAIVPNFMNREQLEVSDSLYETRREGHFRNGDEIRLGYFSGSPSHNRDFAIVAPALENALEEDPRLKVVVAGYIEPGPLLTRFVTRIERHPFYDFITLQQLVGSVAFNLVPLQFNDFTNCKSELKYFEAAVVGTQTIASPTFTYSRAISHGENGYLAQAHQWLDRINNAVGDPDGFEAMAERSRDHARTEYGWLNQRERILAALGLA